MTDVVVVNDSNNTVVINPPDTNNVSVTEKNTTVNITVPTQNQVQVQEQVPNVVQISAYGVPVGLYATTQELTDAINPVAAAIGTHIQEFIDWIESDNLIESINGTTVDAPRQLVQRYLPNFTFTWPFVFADDALGTRLSSNPDGKTYVGMASGKSSPTPTNNPTDYTWVPIAVVDVPDIEVPTFIDTCSVEVADNSSYVLSNQYVSITIFDNDSTKIPTFTFDTSENTFTVNNGLGRVVTFRTGGEEDSLLQLISYFDGNTGNYISHVFKVALNLPTTPTTGSFNGAVETHPSGWVPQPVYKTGIDTWITEGIFEETSPSVWTLVSWTVPKKITNVFGTFATAPNQIGYVAFPAIDSVGYLYWATLYERNEYQITNSSGTTVKSGLVFNSRIDIDTLPVGTYSFEVRVNTGTDYSKWVQHSFVIATPSSVTTLTTEVGNDFITVTRPSGYPNGVVFSVGLTDVSETVPPTELTDMNRSLRFDNLSPETSYKIWIAPVSVLGVGTYTDFTETTTNNASSLLYLLSPTFDGIVSDFATVNQLLTNARDDIESLEDVLTTTNEIVEEVQVSIDHFSERLDGFSASSSAALRQELFDRTETDLTLLTSISRALAAQEEYRRRLLTNENLTDVLISIDYANGTYVNKAFSFTEDKFTQAQLLIDGVNANINLLTESIAWTDNNVTDLRAEIDLIPGIITQTVSSAVSEGLSAVQPAHSFNFFDSTQGWYAVNGTITASLNKVLTTWCDIQNDNLDYVAEENPVIRIDIERTAGTGWDGTVEFTIDGSTVTYSNFIEEPATASQTLLLDLNAFIDTTYSGTVTSMRIILGSSTSDEFIVKSIIIGKNDAAIQELQSITARVTDAELSLDAIEGQLSGFVTSTYYNNNTVTFSNVELTLDALESYAAIKSTYQEINEDDIVTKANTAATFINGYTGTIQDILQGYDVDLEDVNTTLTDISTTLSAQDGRITNQIAEFSAQTHMSYEDSLALLNTMIQTEFGTVDRIKKEFTYAEAINDLKIATSDRGALAQSIQELTAITSTATDTLYAYNQRISAAETDIEGNQLAIEGLNLLVDSASTGLTAALERIDAVEVLSGDNAEALSSVTALVENETTGLSAAYTLAQNAKVSADNSADSLLTIQGTVNDPTTGLDAAYTIASAAKVTADNTADSVTTITNTINDPETGLEAVAAIASGVRTDYDTFVEAYNVFQGKVEDPSTGLTAAYTVASNAETTAGNNATAINLLETTVNDPVTGVSATAALLSTVNQTVGEHTTSINTLTSTIDDEDTGLAATVTTLATLDSSLDDYRTSVQLTVDANGNLGFIQLDGTPSGTTLKLQAGEVEFLDSASNPAIFFDLNENEYSFAGRITLSSKIGTETFEDLQDRSALSKTQLDDISNDNKLTPSEKQATKLELDKINAEYPIITAEASNYGVSSADYTNKHTGINNYLDGLVANLTTTSAINGETFRDNFAQYYAARETLLRAISSKAKTNFDNLTGSLGSLAYDSLVEAAKLGTTIMEGGYIKTSLLDVDVLLAATAVFDGSGNYTGNVTGNIAGTAASTIRDNASTALSTANTVSGDLTTLENSLGSVAYQDLVSRAYLDRDITTALGNLTPNGSTPNGVLSDLVSYHTGITIEAKDSSGITILRNVPTEYTVRFPDDGQYRAARYVENLVCTGGEKYAVKFHFAVESGNTQTVQVRIDFKDIDGNTTQVVKYATQSNNAWTQYDYIFEAPADAVKINAIYLVRITNNYTGGFSYVTGLEVKRVVTGQDILDGAIETAKLGSTIIQGGYIKTSLLDVDTILGNTAIFKGALSAATGTFEGDLNAATGTFTGDLTAAGGTFAGTLSGVDGTFSGNLSAAGGTFKGSLSAATGTFNGTVYAKNFEGDVIDNYVGNFPNSISISSTPSTLFTLTIKAEDFDRTLVVEFTINNYINETANFPGYILTAKIDGITTSIQEGQAIYQYYDGISGLAVGAKTVKVYITIPSSSSNKELELLLESNASLSISQNSLITSSIFQNGDAYNSITFG